MGYLLHPGLTEVTNGGILKYLHATPPDCGRGRRLCSPNQAFHALFIQFLWLVSGIDIASIAYDTRTCGQNQSNDISGDDPLRGYALFHRSLARGYYGEVGDAYKEWTSSLFFVLACMYRRLPLIWKMKGRGKRRGS